MQVDLAAQVSLVLLDLLCTSVLSMQNFVIQVLSESVSKALQLSVGNEACETSKFLAMMNKWFDALNVHNYTHGIRSRKRFQTPYTTSKNMRLKVRSLAMCPNHSRV